MNQILLSYPILINDSLAYDCRDVGESVFNNSHTTHANFKFIQDTRTSQHTVKRAQRRSDRRQLDFRRVTADTPEKPLERGVMKKLFIKLAVLLDEVMKDID